MKNNFCLIFFFLLAICCPAIGQQSLVHEFFSDVIVRLDTSEYTWVKDRVERRLPFYYNNIDPVAEVTLMNVRHRRDQKVELLYSSDFEIVDSIYSTDQYSTFKVRFKDLTKADFLKFVIRVDPGENEHHIDIPLVPYTNTYLELYPSAKELYLGEEKVFELTTNFPGNIRVDNRWSEGLPIDYKTTVSGGKIYLHLLPNDPGKQSLDVSINITKPNLVNDQMVYEVKHLEHSFQVKKGRLAFLQFDKKEVTPNEDNRDPVEIQIDNHYNLRMNKTYRIEKQEQSGGALIAEMFTKNRLNNNKILVELRPYSFHRTSEGYLYIKDGDKAKFVTNVDITPRTAIDQVLIQREGKDWNPSNIVFPGESVNLKLTGKGLHKSEFTFPGANSLEIDSLVSNERTSLFKLNIPKDINSNRIDIFNHGESTNSFLAVKEYQKPKEFDFVDIKINSKKYTVSTVRNIYFEENISDLIISFDRDKIDKLKLHGKQYLTIGVKVRGKNNNLIELYEFDHLVVCPDENSVRGDFYDQDDCTLGDISLNDVLSNKTFDLEEWSKIEIEVKHQSAKHQGKAISRKVNVILKRRSSFDIDVSFPAGLLILELGNGDNENTFSNFGGISFAMIAQFSFYQPGRIAKYKPYRVGAGFIAIDAFNFSENNDRRDVGLVGIGSLYPATKNKKLTFPLYAGMGYLLRKEKAFFLIGPGIRVSL